MGYQNAYLQIPMIMTLTADAVSASFAPLTPATSADYACGLKNWYGSVIHSIQADWNGVTVLQQTNFQGLWNTFKLITTLSYNDILAHGSEIGFYPDDALAVIFSAAANVNGVGTCFTQNAMTAPIVTGVDTTYNSGNIGFFKRQHYINSDPAGLTAPGSSAFSVLLTSTNATTAWKSYIFTKINGTAAIRGVVQWAINGLVKMRHIANLFEKMPLLKGVYLKITLQLNNSVVNFSSAGAGGALDVVSVSSAVGGVVPIQIASAAASNGSVAAFGYAGNYTVSLSVGGTCLNSGQAAVAGVTTSPLGRNITLNVPSYVMAPAFEAAYLSAQVKTIEFEDLFDIELHLDVKGKSKRVDLKEQVESDGTDRMIRLVIVMAIINRLAISSPENKIALFIDEIGTIDEHNRPQLVQFCKEHNFLPIFAAPQPYDGFSKYYFIFRSKGKINLNDKQHAVRREDLKISEN